MESTLHPPAVIVPPRRPLLPGAGNIFRKELQEWFRTRRFVATAGVTSLMLAAVPIIVFLHQGGLHDGRVDVNYGGMMAGWMGLSLTLGSYLIVALTMGVLIKEEESGTAQWIFTKPVSRGGYVLAKFAANAIAVVLAAVVIPSAVFLALTQATQVHGVQQWGGAGIALGLIAANAIITLAVVFALGAFFRSTAVVAGIAIALGFIPLTFSHLIDGRIVNFFPVEIAKLADSAAQGHALTPLQPLVSGLILAVACLAFAAFRMRRRQLQ